MCCSMLSLLVGTLRLHTAMFTFLSKGNIVAIVLLFSVGHSLFQFSVSQIEYPPGGSSKTGSHVYFLLQDFWEILFFFQIVLLFDRNVVLMSQ